MPLPRPMATGPDATASFAASRRAPDFRFRLALGRVRARTHARTRCRAGTRAARRWAFLSAPED